MSARRKRHFEQELFEFAQEDGERRKGVDELLAVVDEYAQPQRFLKLLARIAHFRDYPLRAHAAEMAVARPVREARGVSDHRVASVLSCDVPLRRVGHEGVVGARGRI